MYQLIKNNFILFVLFVLFPALVLLFYITESKSREVQINFESVNAKVISELENKLFSHLDTLYKIRDALRFKPNITEDEFGHVVNRDIQKNGESVLFQWLPLVREELRNEFELIESERTGTDFSITELTTKGKLTHAAQRNYYAPVKYSLPKSFDQRAIGFDALTNSGFENILERVRYDDTAVLSDHVNLIRDAEARSGLVLAMPVYAYPQATSIEKRTLVGFACVVIDVNSVLAKLQHKHQDKKIKFQVSMLNDTDVEEILADQTKNALLPGNALFIENKFGFANRVLKIKLIGFDKSIYKKLTSIEIFALGSFLALMLLAFICVKYQRAQSFLKIKLAREMGKKDSQMKAVLLTAPYGMLAFDESKKINFVNTKYCEIFECDTSDVLGKNIDELLPSLALDLSSQQGSISIQWLNKQNGDVFAAEITYSYLEYSDKKTSCISIKDVTNKVITETELKTSVNTLRIAADIGRFGVFRYNLDSDNFFIGPRAAKILQVKRETKVKRLLRELLSKMSRDAKRDFLNEIMLLRSLKQEYHFEFSFTAQTGDLIDIACSITYENDDEQGQVFTGIVKDVSERNRAQQELNDAIQASESANQAKSTFLANMSHEIRTPINAIVGMSYLAKQTELSPKQHSYVDKINKSANSLLRIINDILDFSKVEAGKLSIEHTSFHIDDVLRDVSDAIALKAEEADITLIYQLDAIVPNALIGDPFRIAQVLINLGVNAIKFSKPNSHVIFNIAGVLECETSFTLKVDVIDKGIGMSAAQCAKVFTPFTQADSSTTRRYGGTGLGLTISQHLLELMGGSISAHSEEGKGSTFSFHIPLKVANEIKKVPDLKPYTKLLHIEDDLTTRSYTREMLARCGFKLIESCSASEAMGYFTHIDKSDVDIIFANCESITPDVKKAMFAYIDDKDQTPPLIVAMPYSRGSNLELTPSRQISSVISKPLIAGDVLNALQKVESGEAVESSLPSSEKEVCERGNIHVLLVEDNEFNQIVAHDLLQQLGLQVSVAENGEQAIAMLATNQFDGIFMDCQMPIMDGYSATAYIRKQDTYKDLPIIALTANLLEVDYNKAMASGMNDYVTKPIELEVLTHKVDKWIIPYAQRQQAQPNGGKNTNYSLNHAQLEELKGYVSRFSTQARNMLLELKKQGYALDDNHDYAELMLAIDNYDFIKAKHVIEDLLSR